MKYFFYELEKNSTHQVIKWVIKIIMKTHPTYDDKKFNEEAEKNI